jgi:hypothetical protein
MTVHDEYMLYRDSFDVTEPSVSTGSIIGSMDTTMMALEMMKQSNWIFI